MHSRKLQVGGVLIALLGSVQADTSRFSPQQQADKAAELVDAMEQNQRRMVELQLMARHSKDILRLNCVNDKLLQTKQLLNLAETAKADVAAGGEGRDDAYSRLTQMSAQVAALRSEADACAGEGTAYVGSTRVTVVSPRVIDDPTTVDPFELGGFSIERPTYATPFL